MTLAPPRAADGPSPPDPGPDWSFRLRWPSDQTYAPPAWTGSRSARGLRAHYRSPRGFSLILGATQLDQLVRCRPDELWTEREENARHKGRTSKGGLLTGSNIWLEIGAKSGASAQQRGSHGQRIGECWWLSESELQALRVQAAGALKICRDWSTRAAHAAREICVSANALPEDGLVPAIWALPGEAGRGPWAWATWTGQELRAVAHAGRLPGLSPEHSGPWLARSYPQGDPGEVITLRASARAVLTGGVQWRVLRDIEAFRSITSPLERSALTREGPRYAGFLLGGR